MSEHEEQLQAKVAAETQTETHETADDDASREMTDEQLREAKEYGRQELACTIVDKVIDIAFLTVAALLLARPLDTWLAGFSFLQPLWLRLGAMYLIVTGLHVAISFPLSFYSGHVLEHRYGLSRQTLWRWLRRYAKRNLLTLAFGILLTQGLFWIIWLSGQYWWLVAAGGFFAVSIVLGQLAPVLILPLFYKITRIDDQSLTTRLSELSDGTGLSIEGVYRMDMSVETAKANAMLAGLGRTRRVILGDTLLDGFSPTEIEVIFAHEVGHHVHKHIRKLILVGLGYSTLSFFLCDRLIVAWVGVAEGVVDYSHLPVFTLPMLMLGITALSIVFEPLQNAVSRHFERQSDWYALQRTQRADAYRSAFKKLAKLNKADPNPHRLEVFLLHSHPPISERLAMADRL